MLMQVNCVPSAEWRRHSFFGADEVRQTIWRFTADASNISIAMEYPLSRIIEGMTEAIHRFRESLKSNFDLGGLKRLKNDGDPDLAYIAQIVLIIIIVAIIARILSHLLY
jgi:hypothetical protein